MGGSDATLHFTAPEMVGGWVKQPGTSRKGLYLPLSHTWQFSYAGLNDSVALQITLWNSSHFTCGKKYDKSNKKSDKYFRTAQQSVSKISALLVHALLMLEVISIKTLIFFCIRATRYNPAFQKGKSVFLSSLGFNVNNKGLIQ